MVTLVGLALIVGLLLAGSGLVGSLGQDGMAGVVTAVVLFGITVPIASALGRIDDDPRLMGLILVAFAAKMAGAVVRYTVLYEAYGGGDATRYFHAGVALAPEISSGKAVFGEITGTRFMEIASGFVYTVLPDTQVAGFLFFSWFSFLGLLFFSRAIRWGLPEADHRRYDLLLFFLPTILFWPSSIGKEAWMVAMIGLASYGVARLVRNSLVGIVPLALGAWGASVVRPHIALMIVVALVPAWLVRPAGRNRLGLSPFARVIGTVGLLAVLGVMATQVSDFFDIERLDSEGAEQVAESTEERTAQGGSAFANDPVDSPADIPRAAVTVVLRPFPWEANNAQSAVTSVEGVVLFLLLVFNRKQLLALPRTIVRHSYVLYALAFSLLYVVAYSTVANFGILVRQRAQLFPLFLVLLVPVARKSTDEDQAESDPTRATTMARIARVSRSP